MSMSSKWNRGRVIGRGSTATVHLASAPSSHELFAVKSAEIRRSSLLQHEQSIHSFVGPSSYLISYLGFNITDEPSGTYYNLFMEYAPGGSLANEIKRNHCGKLSEIEIKSRARDILLGLAHLHSKGIAHCDVKGQNVLMGYDGRAKIADLGCARFVNDDGADAIKKGRPIMGTPMYMAPEVVRGEEQGMAADVWAVGCTVVEMATGTPPWPNASEAVSLLHQIGFTGDTPPVPTWISDEAKDFLGRCLRRDAKQRWTADELLRHPFLSDCKRRSPRSTLDQSCWESVSDDEADEDEEKEITDFVMNKPNVIGELFECDVGSPNWTWGNDWVMVRSGGDELMDPAGVTGSEPIVVGTTSTISNSTDEEFTFRTNHAETCDLRPVSDDNWRSFVVDDNYCVKNSMGSCDNCNSVTMLLVSNWIIVFVNSCHSCFVASSLLVARLMHVKILIGLISRCRPLCRINRLWE